MSKSVYSLVLMDDVVEAVDKLAYSMNTSRSNLINQILAEAVSFTTPEKRMRDIFGQMEELMGSLDSFQVQNQASDAMMTFRSALRYKYKPTIRYSVELYRQAEGTMGELKVSFRTQSQQLIEDLTSFAKLWVRLENKYIGSYFPQGQILYTLENGKLIRKFLLPKEQQNCTSEQLARAISDYIQLLDRGLKTYFAMLDTPQQAYEELEKLYSAHLRRGATII